MSCLLPRLSPVFVPCFINLRIIEAVSLATMAAATPSNAEVLALLATSKSDPTTATKLESYVKAQIESLYGRNADGSSPYCFDANRTLAKLYQYFPHLADESITSLILLLSLLEYPSTDFIALSCLVPARVQEREPCATLARCSDLLERCQFATFWVTFRELIIAENAPEELKGAAASPAAVRGIRRSILNLLSLLYRAAPMGVVLAALDVKDAAALGELVEGDAVIKDMVEAFEGDRVLFVARDENTKRSKVNKAALSLDTIMTNLAAQ